MTGNALIPILNLPVPRHRSFGIVWKITGAFVGTVLVFGLLAIAVVHRHGSRLLQAQIDQRAVTLGMNLSDAAAGLLASRNPLHLHATTTKYAVLPGVAYAYIADRDGKILSYSPGTPPADLETENFTETLLEPRLRSLTLYDRPVQETVVPMLGNRLGTAHVGIWNDLVQEEIRKAILPMIILIASLLALNVIVSLIVSRQIIKPILRLRNLADNMTLGDLDTPIGIRSNDEIGELELSLERMRASLKAAIVRLTRESLGESRG